MPYIKLQIAGKYYNTKVEQDQLTNYLNTLNQVLVNPKPNTVFEYTAENNELKFKKLVFKETALEAYTVLN